MRKILQVCAVILAGLSLLIAIGVATDAMQWWHVALVALCQGCVMTFVTPTRRAIVSVLVDQQHLFNAVSLHTTTLTANRMVAPAIAGFLIDGAGVPVAAVVSAGLYLGTMLLLFPVPESRRHLRTREASFVTDIREGIRYAVRETTVRNLLLIGFVGSVFGAPIQELLPLFQSVLNISASGIGLLLTAMGVGSLLASTTAASLGDFKHKGLLLIGFLALLGAAIIAFSVSSTFLLSLPFMVLVGMGQSGRLAVHLTTLQIYSDPDMRGRVQSLNSMQSGFAPFAVLLITALAEAFSPQWAMGISGLIVVMYCIWEFICNKRIRELE
jgi:predicted MFS family arabinose efflux permease